MSATTKKLVFDIGNTSIHTGIIDVSTFECLDRLDFAHDNLADLHDWIKAFFESCNQSMRQVTISSVVKKTTGVITSLLRDFYDAEVLNVRVHEKLPVNFTYNNPGRLGSDRISSILYAYHKSTSSNTIVINAGTAVTVDLLVGKEFKGGVIFPGPGTQLKSLNQSTDALPLVANSTNCTPIPGKSTQECILAGVNYGIAGALERIVDEYRASAQEPLIIYSTGGAWPYLKNYMTFEPVHVPDLTLIGTALFTE